MFGVRRQHLLSPASEPHWVTMVQADRPIAACRGRVWGLYHQ